MPFDRSRIDVALARRLIETQLPQFAHLPIREVALDGWDNRTFRLGPELTVRLPTGEWYAKQVACDVVIAWTLLSGAARDAFRAGIGADAATSSRGRGSSPTSPRTAERQWTAARVNARTATAPSATANTATTARLRHASSVVAPIPKMSCSPVPRGSTRP